MSVVKGASPARRTQEEKPLAAGQFSPRRSPPRLAALESVQDVCPSVAVIAKPKPPPQKRRVKPSSRAQRRQPVMPSARDHQARAGASRRQTQAAVAGARRAGLGTGQQRATVQRGLNLCGLCGTRPVHCGRLPYSGIGKRAGFGSDWGAGSTSPTPSCASSVAQGLRWPFK